MKNLSILLICISIPIFGSSQGLDTNYIDNRLRDYLFETGSFWVYEKADSTNVIDSLVQTELVHDFNPPIWIHGHPMSGAVEFFKAYYDSKTFNYQTWDQFIGYVIVREGVEWAMNGQYVFLSSYSIGDESEGAEIVNTIDTFKLNRFEFHHVTKMLIMNNKFENNNPTCYYYAKGIGIIRKELFDEDTSHLQEIWNIKNWQVNKVTSVMQQLENKKVLRVFPNPVINYIHLCLNDDNIFNDLILFDLTGKVVYQSRILAKEMDLDLSHLQPGSYIILIEGKNKRQSCRIIKN